MTRFVAPIGPGWVQSNPSRVGFSPPARAHLLDNFPRVFNRAVWTLCRKRLRRGGRVLTYWSFLYQPENPCRDCDRALQVERIRTIASRL